MVVEFVSVGLPILRRQTAKPVKKTASRLAATVGNGEGKWHIFLIRRCKVGSGLFCGNSQLFDNVKFVHDDRICNS